MTLSGLVQLAAVAVVLGYPLTCVVFPYRAHRSCAGRGYYRGGLLGGIRPCAGCQGTGRVLRFGARLMDALTRRRGR